ncbi:MAG: ATP-binding cassette domain-containing protein, partial [Rhodobacteraceae bacterium]|nr:ATP-binding cassette domain-containing protein [Paracoccaceae bacterium]
MNLLTTRGLSRQFGGVKAVQNVDFDLPKGEVRALIGPNGAGKSTFVGLVSGRIPPSDGTIQFDGVDVTQAPAHRRIGLGMAYTFQITSIFAALSLHENVALAARPKLG